MTQVLLLDIICIIVKSAVTFDALYWDLQMRGNVMNNLNLCGVDRTSQNLCISSVREMYRLSFVFVNFHVCYIYIILPFHEYGAQQLAEFLWKNK